MPDTLRPPLVYYPDSEPGIRRRRAGRGFCYLDPDGVLIRDPEERARISALAVPPAYEAVWICPEPRGHLQATGRDARGRKQYRYHPDWTAFRALRKYDGLAAFGAALPRLRRAIRRDLAGEAGAEGFAVAAVLLMIDRLSLRVGSAAYAAENGSFGATTLRHRHLRIGPRGLALDFTAKGGQRLRRQVTDRTLARVLHALDDLPGPSLATWIDAWGRPHPVTAAQVNARLADLVGEAGASAKTFRTWHGSAAALAAAGAAAAEGRAATTAELARAAATRLHNTPAVARASYIHPSILALAGEPPAAVSALVAAGRPAEGLRQIEAALLALLGG